MRFIAITTKSCNTLLFLKRIIFLASVVYSTKITAEALENSCIQRNLMMSIDCPDSCHVLKTTLSEWQFSSPSLLELPLDPIDRNYVRRNVQGVVFSKVLPTPLREKVHLVSYSKDVLMDILDMDPVITQTQEFVAFVAGNAILPGSNPLAHRYGGHQFGTWAMQLGDGRAHLLGEYMNRKGEHWELQLKGSGMTPYSRDGDGRAVLRSSIREFLCSEAMYYLGIPTSRAAAIVVSNDPVQRDQFYNGFPEVEKAAVVLRLSPTWFRFGSLELLAHQKELSTLKTLTDYIIKEHFPNIPLKDKDRYLQMYNEIAHKTLELVSQWQGVGFTHGVLNTDNMSLLSVTIDYGPFGFVDAYQERYSPNNSDKEGRYCYIKQPQVVIWNLQKLAQAISELLDIKQNQQLTEIVSSLESYADQKLRQVFRKKLGLQTDQEGDLQLINSLLDIMQETSSDFTMCFRQLGEISLENLLNREERKGNWALEKLSKAPNFAHFVEMYRRRVAMEPELTEERRQSLMKISNPRYVLRQWMAQSAIAKAEKYDFSEVNHILKVLRNPYSTQEDAEDRGYSQPPPTWAKQIKVSCSS